MFIRHADLAEVAGTAQLRVRTLGSIRLSKMAASITAAHLLHRQGRNAHRGPNLGQVVSAPWARQLFIPHPGHVMVGADLGGLGAACT